MIEMLKVQFQIVGLVRDDDGNPLAEQVVGEGVVYPPRLDDLPAAIRERFEAGTKEET